MARFEVGEVVGGRFELVGVLGRGGTATVWLAHDKLRDERVALKILHDHLATQESMRRRLRREVSAAGRLRHPGALVASELHEIDGRLVISMPVHHGVTLREQVQLHGPVSKAVLLRIAGELLSVLGAAHRAGVLHRDVTPDNVLIDEGGAVTLTDFGLARVEDQRTRTGTQAMGTAGYAAPEAWTGGRVDPRLDLYGLGATLHFAATGHGPFEAPSPMAALQRQLEGDARPLTEVRPELGAGISTLVGALLQRNPEARPEGTLAAQAILDGALPPKPAPRSTQKGPPRSLAKVGLPPGDFTVVLTERKGDKGRRKKLRESRLKKRRNLDEAIEKMVEQGIERLASWVTGKGEEIPEEALAKAVATTAGLPSGGLFAPAQLLEPAFRLVDATDEVTARRLAVLADQAGFDAEVMATDRPPEALAWYEDPRHLPYLYAISGFALMGFLAWFLHSPGLVFVGFAFTGFGWMSDKDKTKAQGPVSLPVAYSRDLRPYLTDKAAHLAESLTGESLPDEAPSVEAAAEPPSGPAGLATRTTARLQALKQAVTDHQGLPDIARRDLLGTTEELLARSRYLAQEVRILEGRMVGESDQVEAERVEARLERLRTRERAGDKVDPSERVALERALAAHLEARDLADQAEASLVGLVGELLEVGAAAERARTTLSAAGHDAGSVGRLVGDLRAQAEGARRTEDEMGLKRRGAAAQRA